MSLTAVNPPGAAWPGLSQGVILKGSASFVTTGHVGTDADGGPVTSSVEDQVVALFENIKTTLAIAGLGFEHVARMTSYVKSFDPEFMKVFRSVRSRYLNQDCPPASVMVQAGLYDDRLLVESEIIAVIP